MGKGTGLFTSQGGCNRVASAACQFFSPWPVPRPSSLKPALGRLNRDSAVIITMQDAFTAAPAADL